MQQQLQVAKLVLNGKTNVFWQVYVCTYYIAIDITPQCACTFNCIYHSCVWNIEQPYYMVTRYCTRYLRRSSFKSCSLCCTEEMTHIYLRYVLTFYLWYGYYHCYYNHYYYYTHYLIFCRHVIGS